MHDLDHFCGPERHAYQNGLHHLGRRVIKRKAQSGAASAGTVAKNVEPLRSSSESTAKCGAVAEFGL